MKSTKVISLCTCTSFSVAMTQHLCTINYLFQYFYKINITIVLYNAFLCSKLVIRTRDLDPTRPVSFVSDQQPGQDYAVRAGNCFSIATIFFLSLPLTTLCFPPSTPPPSPPPCLLLLHSPGSLHGHCWCQ